MVAAARRLAVVGVALVGALAVGFAPLTAIQPGAQFALGTMFFAAVLWVTGAVPLPVTALAIPVLLTVFGIYPNLGEAVAGFADPVIFLLLSGFVLAAAMQAHGIDRRIALSILARIGTSPRRLVLALMVATAALSMAISNTATTAMMVPIAATDMARPPGTRRSRICNVFNRSSATRLRSRVTPMKMNMGIAISTWLVTMPP